jgi:Rrf2 family protein
LGDWATPAERRRDIIGLFPVPALLFDLFAGRQRGFSFPTDYLMKLTHASTHAVAFLAYLAKGKPDAPVPSHEVAREKGLPERFLLKVLRSLVNSGALRSLKGPHGGYRLARDPKDVTLLEVVEAVDGPLRAVVTPVGKEGAALDKRLQAECDKATVLVRERLVMVTLAELERRA